MLWYVRESSVAMYVANLPMIWPTLREWFPFLRTLSMNGRSKYRSKIDGTADGTTIMRTTQVRVDNEWAEKGPDARVIPMGIRTAAVHELDDLSEGENEDFDTKPDVKGPKVSNVKFAEKDDVDSRDWHDVQGSLYPA